MSKLSRHDFLIKDVAVTLAGGGGGGTWLPPDDGELPPSWISPIASVVAYQGLIEAVRATVIDAVKARRFDEVGRAFVAGDTGGSPAIRAAIQEIGTAVVASAAYVALGGGGLAGMPDPECGGTSTIPSPLTPVAHVGIQVHRVSELPRLRKQLAQTVAYVDKAAAAQAPRGEEAMAVRAHLETALKSLGQPTAV
jgi:hypothetical protein